MGQLFGKTSTAAPTTALLAAPTTAVLEPSCVQPEPPKLPKPPKYLKKHIGEGKINIGLAGVTGSGKSALINAMLGGRTHKAKTGYFQTTMIETPYQVSLKDQSEVSPYLQRFIDRISYFERRSFYGIIEDSVTVFDLPGAGTAEHPTRTYATDKGLAWFDFIIVLLPDRPRGCDIAVLDAVMASGVKHIIMRTKFDLEVRNALNAKRREENFRALMVEEEREIAKKLKEEIRQGTMSMIRKGSGTDSILSRSTQKFENIYIVTLQTAATDVTNDPDINELQYIVYRTMLSILKDRYDYDLSYQFPRECYPGEYGATLWAWTDEGIKQIAHILDEIKEAMKREGVDPCTPSQVPRFNNESVDQVSREIDEGFNQVRINIIDHGKRLPDHVINTFRRFDSGASARPDGMLNSHEFKQGIEALYEIEVDMSEILEVLGPYHINSVGLPEESWKVAYDGCESRKELWQKMDTERHRKKRCRRIRTGMAGSAGCIGGALALLATGSIGSCTFGCFGLCCLAGTVSAAAGASVNEVVENTCEDQTEAVLTGVAASLGATSGVCATVGLTGAGITASTCTLQ